METVRFRKERFPTLQDDICYATSNRHVVQKISPQAELVIVVDVLR